VSRNDRSDSRGIRGIFRTIDEKHTELLNDFHNNKTIVIPELKMEITKKKKLLQSARKIEDHLLNVSIITRSYPPSGNGPMKSMFRHSIGV
jgi:hypothetical protein